MRGGASILAASLAIAPVAGTATTAVAEETGHTLYSWGVNDHGQLGDGTTVGRTKVKAIDGEWKSISTASWTFEGDISFVNGETGTGYHYTISLNDISSGVKDDNAVYWWGGQMTATAKPLGNGSSKCYTWSQGQGSMFPYTTDFASPASPTKATASVTFQCPQFNVEKTVQISIDKTDDGKFLPPSTPGDLLQPNGSLRDGIMPEHVFQQAGSAETETVGLDQDGYIWIANDKTPTVSAKLIDNVKFSAIAVGKNYTLALGDPVSSSNSSDKYAGQLPQSGDPAASFWQVMPYAAGVAALGLAVVVARRRPVGESGKPVR